MRIAGGNMSSTSAGTSAGRIEPFAPQARSALTNARSDGNRQYHQSAHREEQGSSLALGNHLGKILDGAFQDRLLEDRDD